MKSFSAGKFINQGYYKSFQPNPINKKWQVDDMQLLNLLSKADRSLGRLDMYSQYVNIELYMRMLIAKEATQSTRIEGTRTNIEDAFLEKEEIAGEKLDDWQEVQNYINAMNKAIIQLHKLPFSSRLIKQAHKLLLQGVRGEYRTSQNWIGGASINDAVFIPPVHTSIPELMSDIEYFANDELNPLPDLLKIGIIHYQFETIHPFLDGNGRVGRLLISLYLVNKGILKKPILYLSDFFERNRMLYYDNLMRVRTHNDIDQWLKFFLTGIIEISKKGVETFDSIFQLQRKLENKIQSFGARSNDTRKIIDFLWTQPIVDASRITKLIKKSKATSYKLLDILEQSGILKEITGGQRNQLYVFADYLKLFKS